MAAGWRLIRQAEGAHRRRELLFGALPLGFVFPIELLHGVPSAEPRWRHFAPLLPSSQTIQATRLCAWGHSDWHCQGTPSGMATAGLCDSTQLQVHYLGTQASGYSRPTIGRGGHSGAEDGSCAGVLGSRHSSDFADTSLLCFNSVNFSIDTAGTFAIVQLHSDTGIKPVDNLEHHTSGARRFHWTSTYTHRHISTGCSFSANWIMVHGVPRTGMIADHLNFLAEISPLL